jgi:alpha-beta hydrolase superfamily lysophospholipase
MPHSEFERASFDGLKLYFQLWQAEQSPKGIVFLVHGLGEHSGRYAHWAAFLNEAGYDLIAYDLRGHGKSGGQRGHVSSFEDYVKDTDILLKEAEERYPGLPRFLYGHSLGGLIVNYYVLLRKPNLNGVVVSALSNKTSLQEQKAKVMLSKILGSIVTTMTINTGLIPATISRDPEIVSRYINDPLVHHQVTVGWGKSALETIAWSDQHAGEWNLPVLFMHGEKDELGFADGSREFASRIKGECTLKIWPGLFHEVHNEPEKQQVFAYLLNWLDLHLNQQQ